MLCPSVFERLAGSYQVELEDTKVGVSEYTAKGSKCTFLALEHSMFMKRTKANIYPDSRNPQYFMEFMGLWNRCCVYLIEKLNKEGKVQVVHLLDCALLKQRPKHAAAIARMATRPACHHH